jgi:hypothetical protein
MDREPSERERFEVLLERVEHRLQIVADGYVALDQKIDRIAHDLGERVNRLEQKVDVGFRQVLLELRALTGRVEALERAGAR